MNIKISNTDISEYMKGEDIGGKIFSNFQVNKEFIRTNSNLEILTTDEAVAKNLIPNGEPIILPADVSGVGGHKLIPDDQIPKQSVALVPGEYYLETGCWVPDMASRYMFLAIQFYKSSIQS